ncbi:MAG: hypothetical protein QOG56_2195 [Solirubrobacteraceae bacterium]|jgi:hypothetical protein|nr:hypothetical protein [Solirubrobacteraceae bacterium]
MEFGVTADAERFGEMQRMPELLRARKLTSADVDGSLIHGGSWKRLVFAAPGLPDGAIDKNAYVFCVLTAIIAISSAARSTPTPRHGGATRGAQVLAGDAWKTAKPVVLSALSLPAAPDELLARHAQTLDDAYRAVGARLEANTAIGLDVEGQLHIERLEDLWRRDAQTRPTTARRSRLAVAVLDLPQRDPRDAGVTIGMHLGERLLISERHRLIVHRRVAKRRHDGV